MVLLPDLNTIKRKRIELNLTQKQLASETGISQSLIAKLEAKKVSPSYDIVKRLLEKFEQLEHKKEIICGELINKHKKLIFIKTDDKVKHASDLMRLHAISQLPVFESGRLVGNISESNIYNKLLENDKSAIFNMKVKKIMEDPLPTISISTPRSIAMPLLKTYSAVLLMEKDKIIGILTKEDFISKS